MHYANVAIGFFRASCRRKLLSELSKLVGGSLTTAVIKAALGPASRQIDAATAAEGGYLYLGWSPRSPGAGMAIVGRLSSAEIPDYVAALSNSTWLPARLSYRRLRTGLASVGFSWISLIFYFIGTISILTFPGGFR